MNNVWGYHLRINASGLNPEKIRSKEYCENFLLDLCKHINMTPYGLPMVTHFGDDPKVSGFTLILLIQESNFAGHLVNIDNTGYFDVFSCKPFNVEKAVVFIVDYFEAKAEEHDYIERQAPSIDDDSEVDKYEHPDGSD